MFTATNCFSQTDDNSTEHYGVPFKLVDFPTAATLPRASFNVEIEAFSNGGMLGMINIGLHNRFTIGISYGGMAVLGDDKAEWFDRPEFLVKFMIIDENLSFPAIALGFESQGTGFFDKDLDRYRFKAPGFYLVASKGYRTYSWESGLHVGININTLEDDRDNDDDISFFGGFDITFNNSISITGEYQAALNDNKKDTTYGRGRGYLNFGFHWNFFDRLSLGAVMKDLLNNTRGTNSFTRELRIIYSENF